METVVSARQLRKQKRANQTDKWGMSKALSRRQRRALRRNVVARSYKTAKGSIVVLEIGGVLEKDNIGSATQRLYGGGSMKSR